MGVVTSVSVSGICWFSSSGTRVLLREASLRGRTTMHNQSIICFANDWESDPTSKHQIMRILSRSNQILWVNSIGMRRPSISRSDVSRIWTKLTGCAQGLKRVNQKKCWLDRTIRWWRIYPRASGDWSWRRKNTRRKTAYCSLSTNNKITERRC